MSGSGDLLPHTSAAAREDTLDVGDRLTISDNRRRRLVDGEQWLARRKIRTELELTLRCVPRAPQRAVSTIEGA